MHSFFKNLYEEIGQDKNLLIELSEDFITLYKDNINLIKEGLQTSDYEKVDKIAHKIKGASMNFTMKQFTNAARIIEMAGKNQDLENVDSELSILENEFKKFKIELMNLKK